MRGTDNQQADMYSYVSPEARVRADHPLRKIRTMADEALANMSRRFDSMYAKIGRPSIPPEKLLRAQLIQMLYSVRSERLLMEEIDYSIGVQFGKRELGGAAERREVEERGVRCAAQEWGRPHTVLPCTHPSGGHGVGAA